MSYLKLTIGVMGSASGEMKREALEKAYELGKAIAKPTVCSSQGRVRGFHTRLLGAVKMQVDYQ
jgi:hypothetical protein